MKYSLTSAKSARYSSVTTTKEQAMLLARAANLQRGSGASCVITLYGARATLAAPAEVCMLRQLADAASLPYTEVTVAVYEHTPHVVIVNVYQASAPYVVTDRHWVTGGKVYLTGDDRVAPFFHARDNANAYMFTESLLAHVYAVVTVLTQLIALVAELKQTMEPSAAEVAVNRALVDAQKSAVKTAA